tara:strand:+ start:1243 stop:1476 length:234 start_codon:yes stop_codon:yes gene_type:complete
MPYVSNHYLKREEDEVYNYIVFLGYEPIQYTNLNRIKISDLYYLYGDGYGHLHGMSGYENPAEPNRAHKSKLINGPV